MVDTTHDVEDIQVQISIRCKKSLNSGGWPKRESFGSFQDNESQGARGETLQSTARLGTLVDVQD